MTEYHNSAIAIERIHFPKTDRAVDPKKQDPLLYLPGEGKLLVTAPYAVRYGSKKKPKPSAESTGSIAYLLHEACHCHVLASRKFYGEDPELDVPCIFKEKMAEIILVEKVKLVLNLTALPSASIYDAEFTVLVPEKQTNAEKFLTNACQNLAPNVHIEGGKTFPSHTIAGEALMNGAGAINVRLKKSLRVPRQNPGAFNALMTALIRFIEDYS